MDCLQVGASCKAGNLRSDLPFSLIPAILNSLLSSKERILVAPGQFAGRTAELRLFVALGSRIGPCSTPESSGVLRNGC